MTDQDRDPKVSQRYRELSAEEPPRALDEAILAAARREAGTRPATLAAQAALAVRTGRQRWYAPLATAAVLVLAVAVTLNMQVERPDIAEPKPDAKPPAAASAPAPAAPAVEAQLKSKTEERRNAAAKDAGEEVKTARRKVVESPAKSEPQAFPADRAPAATSAPQPAPAFSPPPPAAAKPALEPGTSVRSDEARGAASSVTGVIARQAEERTSRDAEAAARAPRPPAPAPAKPAAAPPVATVDLARPAPRPAPAAKPMPLRERPAELTPERELERIADLRRQERHEEADKALAEFRKRHPDYKISGAVLERVERR